MVFSTLSQTFSFHSSPESFISSRLESLAVSDPSLLPSPASPNKIITASLLNRTVHVVSSYQLCKDIMEVSSSPDPSALAACRSVCPNSTSSSSSSSATSFFSSFSSAVKAGAGENKKEGNRSSSKLKPDTLLAAPAYDELMADFFPAPNILLQDGPSHAPQKQAWRRQLATFPDDTASRVRRIAEKHVTTTFLRQRGGTESDSTTSDVAMAGGAKIDLYKALKSMAWEILLGVVLDVSPSGASKTPREGNGEEEGTGEADFAEIEALQETLLRGQFSLFPVAFNAKVWQSPRSKGIQARKELQSRLTGIINVDRKKQASRCPLLKAGQVSDQEAASHALLFTSSIAVKALTSLLMAVTMNLFLWRGQSSGDGQKPAFPTDSKVPNGGTSSLPDEGSKHDPSSSLADMIRARSGSEKNKTDILNSILLETERLSPPVIGLMRRVQHDIVLHTSDTKATTTTSSNSSTHPISAGQDIWLYLPLASRDPTVFGPDASTFKWDRYYQQQQQQPQPQPPQHQASDSSSPPETPTHQSPSPPPPPPEGLAFGTGPKECLGMSTMRRIVLTVAQALVDANLDMSLDVDATPATTPAAPATKVKAPVDNGVKAWLGWVMDGGPLESNANVQRDVASDMKQLPVQRPRRSIRIRVSPSCPVK